MKRTSTMKHMSTMKHIGQMSCLVLVFAILMLPRPLGATEGAAGELKLHVRSQVLGGSESRPSYQTAQDVQTWNPTETAIVVCDMWDKHWCRGATTRVAEMASRLNEVCKAARDRGVLIIHCPSSCLDFYRDTPARATAIQAGVLAQKDPRWNPVKPLQGWCSLDPKREPILPIDDSDGGCDCDPPCKSYEAWTRQIETIEIRDDDAITDNSEAYFLMKQRGIKNVMVMGVHTNMCVLGRPFSIRQMVDQGQNVVLVRDLTDSMYNSRMSPYVGHFDGTRLVVQHIERHWCPTIQSTDIDGKPAFRFAKDLDTNDTDATN